MTLDPELAAFADPGAIADAKAARERRQATVEALEHVAVSTLQQTASEVLFIAQAKHPAYQRFALQLRTTECVSCLHPMSIKARRCPQRWHDDVTHDIDDQPLCKHTPEFRHWLTYEVTRRARMHSALIKNEDQVAIIPVSVKIEDAFPRVPEALLQGPRMVAAAVERFLFEGSRCLTLCGPLGTWKSWGAAWICASVDGSLWVDCTQIKQVDDAWKSLAHRAEKAPLVVLNDVGLEHGGNEFGRGEVSRLVNLRDDRALRTVITANIPMERRENGPSLEGIYGVRMKDRLTRKSGIVARIQGPSIRSAT